jgi:hypothetical protein
MNLDQSALLNFILSKQYHSFGKDQNNENKKLINSLRLWEAWPHVREGTRRVACHGHMLLNSLPLPTLPYPHNNDLYRPETLQS